ncbi:Na+/H+ antiporter [Lederbergia wuyishanensis]|uniref:CPA1 family monovalent cation:H+ antiporter n=1 Tax=Lederbergia wuyishanensis TaxID=1347903 RepID=A0ABU0D818_9BACI|nr:Na+/H+ antiporter [Lederbergia wuyishanensis]MCJ8009326.1 Na+/H+ antiporter [Lederbergia wuyishanensis]MDQ0344540.1 CPA1 family monovalent cation:H+ antiporter [Lederbergia wuyishanensis]
MELLMVVLLLLVCLLISNIISHYIPFIPTALTQIAFGIVLAFFFKNISFTIETEWFLLLFVAPLLYNDGRHYPRKELWKLRAPIFGNAIVLVLLTTMIGGLFIHWMIPSIPLAAAFALAAILSPTDPVAVNGISKRIHIPERVLNLVRGESLINDASGLVAFNYAIAAVVTGNFSLTRATVDFIYMFLVGAISGVILSLLIMWIRFTLRKQGIQDVTFHSLLQIITPFLIYMIAEEFFHASGVIAVVIAGIVHTLIRERTETLNAEEQVLTENIWTIVLFILNGIVFLLLGLNIPSSMASTVENPDIGNGLAVLYVIMIGFVILSIRFIWSYIFSYSVYRYNKLNESIKPNLKTSLFISLTGVRGAVTMAGVLSIPYLIINGNAFPERSLILFLAAGVILFTLVAATVFLPLLSKNVPTVSSEMDLIKAKREILLAATQTISLEMNEENKTAAYELMDEYKVKLQQIHPKRRKDEDTTEEHKKMAEIRLIGLKAERKYIQELIDKKGMDENVLKSFEKSLNHREEVLSNNIRSRFMYLIGLALRGLRRYRIHKRKNDKATLYLGKQIQIKAFQAAIETLEETSNRFEKNDIVYEVIHDYKRLIERLKKPSVRYNEKIEEQKDELRIKVMDVERSKIHEMYQAGEITREQARELRRFINYIESVTLNDHIE